jgi:uncharacterized LabA/DUF88 family protein
MVTRVAIFIDGGYVDKLLRHEFSNAKISYERFVREIADQIRPDLDILRTYYYHCEPYKSDPPTTEESKRFGAMQNFLDALRRLPRFEVRLGRLARRTIKKQEYRFEQKMVDVLLSVDLVRLSARDKISHAAIVAGDSDFVPAIKVARDEGVSIWLFHGQKIHNELWETVDERRRITAKMIDKARWVEKRLPTFEDAN